MKILKTILLTALLTGIMMPLLSSCNVRLSGTETAVAFLEKIRERDFAGAYKYVQNDLDKNDFVETYESFFDALEINSMEYKKISSFENDIHSEYVCSVTYHTDICDDIVAELELTIGYEDTNRRYVSWSPSLILPEMEEGDFVQRIRLTAKRGDIIAEHASLAETVPQKAVSINTVITDDHTKGDIERAVTIVADALKMPEEDVREKLKIHITFSTKTGDDDKDTQSAVDNEKEKAADILGINTEEIDQKLADALAEKVKKAAENSESDEAIEIDKNDLSAEIAAVYAYDYTDDYRHEIEKLTHIKVSSSVYNGVALVAELQKTRFDEDVLSELAEKGRPYGVIVSDSAMSTSRYYPQGSMLAHVLGYMGSMSADGADEMVNSLNEGRTELDGLYTKYSRVGASGLEQVYEKQLRGYDGYRVYISSKDGQNKRTITEKPAQNGLDVQLTVDYELQQKAEALIKNTIYGDVTGGTVIVMNPETGKIEAMCSYPDYDLNLFSTGITAEEYAALSEVKGTFTNKATQGRFIPGSVIKAITAAAALTNHVIDTDYVFDGEIVNDTWRIPEKYGSTAATDRIKRDKVKRRNEPLNMRNAFVHSDNIYFANMMLKMGDTRFEEYWNSLRMNENIDFELPVASSQYKQKDAERTIITIAETGFGQGTMLVTPLQLAATYCAFANGGSIPVPYIVDGLYKDEGTEYTEVEKTTPRMWKENAIKGHICDDITEMLKDVTSPLYNGTASQLYVRSCTVAGKTGTAQTTKGRNNSWFIGYRTGVSAENARLCLVLLEVPSDKEYSSLKLKIARELLEIGD